MAVDIIARQNAEAIIREQVVPQIFQDVPKESAFLSMARKLPNMTSNQTRIRVLDTLPMAYWVNGDTGMKQTSKQAWDNVYLTAAELAVIVPIPEAVLADAEIDIIGEVTPRIREAIGNRIDAAILFGNDKPAEWEYDIITRARQAGNNVAPSTLDMYDLVMAEGGVLDKVESAGYAVNGIISGLGMRAKLRGLRTTDGVPIFSSNMQGSTPYAIDGTPLKFLANGAFDKDVAQMIVGDFTQAVYAIRQDITVKILDQGIIQDPSTKEIVYNLAQQDMIALRVVFRMGWALPNPATRLDENRTSFPFAYLEPATPVTTYAATFTVTTGSDDDEEEVEGALVDVVGARKFTTAAGKAVYNLRPGTYKYTVKADGFKKYSGSITVASSAVSEAVNLIANS